MLEEAMGYKKAAEAKFKKADGIADEGKTFEKPDIDQVIKDNKNKPKQKIELSKKEKIDQQARVEQKPETPPIAKTENKADPSIKDYIRVVKEVFTSKEVFKDFLRFAKGKFLFKKKRD